MGYCLPGIVWILFAACCLQKCFRSCVYYTFRFTSAPSSHGRRMGVQFYIFLSNVWQKGCSLSLEWKKMKYQHCSPLELSMEKSTIGPPRKNPSDAHASRFWFMVYLCKSVSPPRHSTFFSVCSKTLICGGSWQWSRYFDG